MILNKAQRGIDIGPKAPRRKIREVTEPTLVDGVWLYPIDWSLTPMRAAWKARQEAEVK
jgi:hypothetical protein